MIGHTGLGGHTMGLSENSWGLVPIFRQTQMSYIYNNKIIIIITIIIYIYLYTYIIFDNISLSPIHPNYYWLGKYHYSPAMFSHMLVGYLHNYITHYTH